MPTPATFPIVLETELIYPQDLALLYDAAHDLGLVADERGVFPRDIKETWPNVLGFLRRVPGQPYHRPSMGNTPTREEIVTFRDALLTHTQRIRRALQGGL